MNHVCSSKNFEKCICLFIVHCSTVSLSIHHSLSICFLMGTWRTKWQPTPVFLPGESHGRRSLVDYTAHGVTKSGTRLSDFTSTLDYFWFLTGLQGLCLPSFKTEERAQSQQQRYQLFHKWGSLPVWRKFLELHSTMYCGWQGKTWWQTSLLVAGASEDVGRSVVPDSLGPHGL